MPTDQDLEAQEGRPDDLMTLETRIARQERRADRLERHWLRLGLLALLTVAGLGLAAILLIAR